MPIVQSTWAAWKALRPDTTVLQVATFSAMWFAWASFNPDTEIFLAN